MFYTNTVSNCYGLTNDPICHNSGCGSLSPPVSLMLLTILLFISLLFGLFTGIMFGTQIYAILDDQTVCHTNVSYTVLYCNVHIYIQAPLIV